MSARAVRRATVHRCDRLIQLVDMEGYGRTKGGRAEERGEAAAGRAHIPAVCPLARPSLALALPPSLSLSISLYLFLPRTREEYRVTQTYRRVARQRG